MSALASAGRITLAGSGRVAEMQSPDGWKDDEGDCAPESYMPQLRPMRIPRPRILHRHPSPCTLIAFVTTNDQDAVTRLLSYVGGA
jgi:hypothetical protein